MLPFSKLKHSLALILKEQNYLARVERIEQDGKPALLLALRYLPDGASVIRSLQRVSKPGRRVYAPKKALPYVQNNFGIAIISTSKGLMTNKEARQKKLGGEVICEIY
ncbi:MAG: hypothetical protein ACD_43C00052G0014 [uncultured bacterium]|nr:MAG: hypothetical protein ACD_43C00052G0014 [uncultured bacterium]